VRKPGRRVRTAYNSNRAHLAREDRSNLVRSFKNVPCADCGVKYPWYVMDFDHVRGRKFKSIGQMSMACRYAIGTLIEEILKCEVVCANCHREREFVRGVYRHPRKER